MAELEDDADVTGARRGRRGQDVRTVLAVWCMGVRKCGATCMGRAWRSLGEAWRSAGSSVARVRHGAAGCRRGLHHSGASTEQSRSRKKEGRRKKEGEKNK